ncbi:mon2, putative [Ichthyophthirius multifiliis]|uniref:Mon2, putative n=1 Tax=Ichthyophthirius multifiliis TaxID=5932 RepID=G0QZX0_ICHMU|nr:mon2, putative [Ichthyophthirius multifiliis]EGR29232.1 mon2, putative [Ichthyophthirius multifiliis]|eukprot:XP_004030468.1 mon2, putative [Ichthyophthirius multifiliis]
MLFSPKIILCKNYQLISKVLNICLVLQSNKDIMIRNTSLAGPFQLIHIVFQHLINSIKQTQKLENSSGSQSDGNESKNKIYEEENKEQTKIKRNSEDEIQTISYSQEHCDQINDICLRLFNEIISLMLDKQLPEWVPQNINGLLISYQEIGFDLLLSLLKQIGRHVKYCKQIEEQITNKLVSFAIENISQDYTEFKFGIRIIQLSSILVNNYFGYNEILQKIYVVNKSINKIYIYTFMYAELFSLCLNNPKFIYISFEQANNNLNDQQDKNASRERNLIKILEITLLMAQSISQFPDAELRKQINTNIKGGKILERNEIEYQSTEPPLISYNMFYSLLIEVINHLTESLMKIYQERQEKIQNQIPDNNEISNIINLIWKDNLRIIKQLLSKQVSEQYSQNLLNQIQNWINIAGSLQLYKICDQYIKILANNCLPQKNNDEHILKPIEIQSTKILFNIAHCLGGKLGKSSWFIMLQTMQRLDTFFNKKLIQIDNNKPQKEEDLLVQSELQILSDIMSKLFSSSDIFDDSLLIIVIDSLNQLNLSILEQITIEQQQKKPFELNSKKFGFLKLKETVLVNISRIDLFWSLIIPHLILLSSEKQGDLRMFSIDILNNIINNAFNYFSSNIYSPSQKNKKNLKKVIQKFKETDSWNQQNWQKSLLMPYKEVILSQFTDTQDIFLLNLIKIIQNNGHEINQNGYLVILDILQIVSTGQQFQNTLTQGLKCLSIIINQHITIINRYQLKIIIDLIENFRQSSKDKNSIYQSVEFLWNIGDQLAKLHQNLLKDENIDNNQLKQQQLVEIELLWESLFQKLINIINEPLEELRQSAIVTLTQLFMTNSIFFSKKFWFHIIKEIYIKNIEKLIHKILQQFEENTSSLNNQINIHSPQYQIHLQTPKFFGISETPKFQISSQDLSKVLAHSQMQNSQKLKTKAWEETCIILIQSLQKILKKGFNADNFIDLYLSIIAKGRQGILINNQQLILEFFKIIKDFVQNKGSLGIKIIDEIKDFILQYQSTMEFIGLDIENDKQSDSRISITETIPEIIETFENLLLCAGGIESRSGMIVNLYIDFYKSSLNFCQRIDFMNSSHRMLLFQDENARQIYDYVENIGILVLEKTNFQIQNEFMLFMNELINIRVDSRLSYLMNKKFLKIFQNVILNQSMPGELQDIFTKYYFAKIENILELRFDKDYFELHSQKLQIKKYVPLWIFVFEQFIYLAKNFSQKNKFYTELFFIIENLLKRPKEKIYILPVDMQDYIKKEIIKIEAVCIEFIIEQMLSEEQELDEYIISRMIEILENYIDSKKKTSENTTSTDLQEINENNDLEIRKNYISNFFLLAKAKSSKNKKFEEVAKIVLPILILRQLITCEYLPITQCLQSIFKEIQQELNLINS